MHLEYKCRGYMKLERWGGGGYILYSPDKIIYGDRRLAPGAVRRLKEGL
jgi:hypothetical protein